MSGLRTMRKGARLARLPAGLLVSLLAAVVARAGTVLDFAAGLEGFADTGQPTGEVTHVASPGTGSMRLTNAPNWTWRAKRTFTKGGDEEAKYRAFADELAAAGVNGGTLHFDLILRNSTAVSGKAGGFWGVQYNLAINQAAPSGGGWVQTTFLQLPASAYPPAQSTVTRAIGVPLRPWAESSAEMRIHPGSEWFELQFGSNFGNASGVEWHIDNLRVVPEGVAPNQPPAFPAAALNWPDAAAGAPYLAASLASIASDPNPGDALSFAKVSGPAWLVVEPDGSLGGTPAAADLGSNSFVVRVSDPAGLTAETKLEIRVVEPPGPGIVRLEAETGALTGTAVSSAVAGYSGNGYVTGFDAAGDKVQWSFQAGAGVYRLLIRYRTPFGPKGFNGSLNGAGLSGMFPGSTAFAGFDAGLVELRDGNNTLEIGGGWNWYEIDAATLTPEQPVLPLPVPAVPCDPLATPAARALLAQVTAGYGSLTLSGQHETADTAHILDVSGELPAIIEGDLIDYSPSRVERQGPPAGYTESILARHAAGHLVNFCWHWNAPAGLLDTAEQPWWRGFYTEATSFDVAAALADPAGGDHALLLRDIDAIAVQLKKAADAGIAVLWRPLHESEGGWFWWGAKGPAAFKQLWRLLYQRLAGYHGLHNLVWVLTGEQPDWYPGDDVVDVVGIDGYPDNRSDPLSARWGALLERFDGIKPLALTEFGGVPDIGRMHRLGVTWAWFCSWSGSSGPASEPDDKVARIYRSAEVVSLDELAAPATPWKAWCVARFGDVAGDPLLAGEAADPDRDGMVNLMEYALATDPLGADRPPVACELVTVGEERFLRLTATRNPQATDLVYQVEVAGDLAAANPWTTADTVVLADEPGRLAVRDTVAGGPRFIRLRVVRQP